MKRNQLEKKLSLNKKTIAHLMEDKMEEIKGGMTNTCYSEDPKGTCTFETPPSLGGYTLCIYCIP